MLSSLLEKAEQGELVGLMFAALTDDYVSHIGVAGDYRMDTQGSLAVNKRLVGMLRRMDTEGEIDADFMGPSA